ncbi:REP-associated tyrosine transposase [Phytobacter sp. AG2a]
MSSYRRYYVPGGTWFFTVNLRDRQSDLLTCHIDLLRKAVSYVQRKQTFEIRAWVILPEHMHCIWTLPENDSDYSGRWREIKKVFTKSVGLQDVWQPRFWEHTIRDDEDLRHHIDYIYVNPLKHGWVKRVQDWPWSTFHRDVCAGLYPEDWAGECETLNTGERR